MANVFLNDLKLQKVWDAIRKNFYPVPPESGTAQPPTPAMEGDITIAFGRYTSGQYQGYLNSIVSTIGDGKVTTSKLADSAVTKAKLAAGAIDPVVTWGNGTTLGPTITIQAGKDTSVPKAVPAATAEYSGIITTTTQTMSGNKTFKGNILGEQNIEALFGVSAHGHADLSIAAGGGAGTVTCISVNDAVKEPDGTGMITLDDYPTLTAYNADKTQINSAISQINSKIPIAATASNQLADKDFVNSSINTATATFRGTYTAANDTEAAAQTALAGITTKDLNDYAFVKVENTPQTGIDKYKRYKHNGNNWSYEYTLNNSSFTASQWDAINSTITSAKVDEFNAKYKKPATGIPATDLDEQSQTLLVLASTALQRVDFFNLGDHDTPVYFDAHGYGQVIDALSVPGNIESTGGGVAAHGHADLGISAGGGSGTTTAVRIGNGSPIEAVDGVVTIPTAQISQQPDGTIALGGVAIAVKGLGSFAYRSSINLSEVVGATDVVSSLSNAISQTHAMAEDNSENIAEHDERITDLETAFDGSSVKYALDADKVDGHHASEFVGALGVSGNNLTWTRIGGTAQNITIPYATNAGQLGGVALGGLFTALTNDGNQISATIGDVNKKLTVAYASNAGTLGGVALGGLFTLLANDNKQLSATIGGVNKKLTLDYAKKSTTLETEPFPNQEFIFRNSPKTIGADSLKLDRIYGKTLAWNQMQYNGDFSNGTDKWIANYCNMSVSNNEITVTVRAAFTPSTPLLETTPDSGQIVGHKYYFRCELYIPSTNTELSQVNVGLRGNPTFYITTKNSWVQVSGIQTSTSARAVFVATINSQLSSSAVGDYAKFRNINVIDLTLMFGSAIDGMTDAQILAMFEALYPNAYYEYNPGQLINNSAEGLETVGFNLWDEEWENGELNNQGQPIAENTKIRSANFCKMLPEVSYYFKGFAYLCFYDANFNFISSTQPNNSTFTSPSNAYYFKFNCARDYGAYYNNDICINKSDTAKNGTYEPYRRELLPLNLDKIQVKSHNIWDEEWELGYYSASDGSFETRTNGICSKHDSPISVIPNTTYYLYVPYGSTQASAVMYYDNDDRYISYSQVYSSSNVFTTPANARYIRFYLNNAYGATYNNDICINESSSFNGQYEPHGILTKTEGLKGKGEGRDVLYSNNRLDNKSKRINLGDLNWSYTSGANSRMVADLPGIKVVPNTTVGNLTCSKYVTDTSEHVYAHSEDGIICVHNFAQSIWIYDSAYTDAATFKSAMSGVYLDYELATPIEYELAAPIPNTMPAGTTERVISDRLPVTPFACDMTYGTNPGDILASGIAWEKIWGRPTIVHDKSNVSLTTLDRHVINIGDKELYLIFSVGSDGTSYTLRVATGLNNGVYENEQVFNFATIDDTTINNICHL